MKGKETTLVKHRDSIYSEQITNIRALAILIVVFGHSIILYSSAWNLYSTINKVPVLDYVKDIINLIQMPLFFSISGYLFMYSHNKHRGIIYLIKDKAYRLLLPYLLITFIYMVPIKVIIKYPGYVGKKLDDLIWNLLTGQDMGHLWFLLSLYIIFIISEVTLIIEERIFAGEMKSAVVLFVTAIILYYFRGRLSMDYAPLRSALTYMIWFTLGYLLCTFQYLLKRMYEIVAWKYCSIVISNILLILCSYFNISESLEICCVGLWIINIYGVFPAKTRKGIQTLSEDSFGIYLFHSPLIYFTFTFMPNVSPIVVVLVNFFVFGGLAILITEVVRKIGLLFVIGEKGNRKIPVKYKNG